MKRALWGSLLLCSGSFAQTTPDNAAADALKKRLEGLKILNAPKPAVAPRQVLLQAAPAKICSVPLLNAMPVTSGRDGVVRRNIVAPPDAAPAAPPGETPMVAPNAGSSAELDRMPVITPHFPGRAGDYVRVPAPPCER